MQQCIQKERQFFSQQFQEFLTQLDCISEDQQQQLLQQILNQIAPIHSVFLTIANTSLQQISESFWVSCDQLQQKTKQLRQDVFLLTAFAMQGKGSSAQALQNQVSDDELENAKMLRQMIDSIYKCTVNMYAMQNQFGREIAVKRSGQRSILKSPHKLNAQNQQVSKQQLNANQLSTVVQSQFIGQQSIIAKAPANNQKPEQEQSQLNANAFSSSSLENVVKPDIPKPAKEQKEKPQIQEQKQEIASVSQNIKQQITVKSVNNQQQTAQSQLKTQNITDNIQPILTKQSTANSSLELQNQQLFNDILSQKQQKMSLFDSEKIKNIEIQIQNLEKQIKQNQEFQFNDVLSKIKYLTKEQKEQLKLEIDK